jgi:hypothetical protein
VEPLVDAALQAVSLVSPALADAEREDSPEALAAALAAARLVTARVEAALAGRVDEATVTAVQDAARVALGW